MYTTWTLKSEFIILCMTVSYLGAFCNYNVDSILNGDCGVRQLHARTPPVLYTHCSFLDFNGHFYITVHYVQTK